MTRARDLNTDRITPLHIFAAAGCAIALALDMVEMAIGHAFAAVFSATPYNMGASQLSWLLAAVYAGAVLGAPVLGWLSDRRGLRFCLSASLFWLGLTSILAAMSAVDAELVAMRFLSGLSLGAIPPLLIAYLTQIAPPRYRGIFIMWVCGIAALAPPLTLFSLRSLVQLEPLGIEGWRWPLAVAGALALATGAFFSALPQHARAARRPSFVNGMARQPEHANHRGRFAFVASIYFFLPWASVGFPLLTGPILLQRGYELRDALLFVALTTIGPTFGSLLAGLVIDRIERRAALVGCAAIMASAVTAFWFATSALWTAGALVTFGVAAAIYVTVLTLYAAEIFPAGIRTFATSSAWAINRGASAAAPILLFPLIASHSVSTLMLPICAALVGSMLLISLVGPIGAAGQAVD